LSEPKAVAAEVSEVVPGVWHWRIEDERINGFTSAAHAVASDHGVVLIDPLPLAPEALVSLGPVAAICVSAGVHQRSAWRFRRELAAEVWMPALSRQIDEEPDRRYGDGDVLPGGLRAIFTPGAGTTQHSFLLDEPSVLFTPDLLVRAPEGPLELTSAEFVHDPNEQRSTVERLLELDFAILCTSHGAPVTDDPKDAIRVALSGIRHDTTT
jgi:glyoxylase-like metal-dependent hydrolase (beta-lactamase superfamily II)